MKGDCFMRKPSNDAELRLRFWVRVSFYGTLFNALVPVVPLVTMGMSLLVFSHWFPFYELLFLLAPPQTPVEILEKYLLIGGMVGAVGTYLLAELKGMYRPYWYFTIAERAAALCIAAVMAGQGMSGFLAAVFLCHGLISAWYLWYCRRLMQEACNRGQSVVS